MLKIDKYYDKLYKYKLKDSKELQKNNKMKKESEEKKEKIELTLHHDYLQIERGTEKIQLPIRAAKLIKDMYELRNAEHEKKDLLHYSQFDNSDYELNVFVMNASFDSTLQWVTKQIKKYSEKDFKELNNHGRF